MKNNATGVQRIVKAFGFSVAGLRAAFVSEAAFRQEVLLACLLVPAGLWLGNTGVERALLVASVLLILIVELLNSAVETVVDRIGSDYHELSGRAKDIGSAAVLLAFALTVLVWCSVLVFR